MKRKRKYIPKENRELILDRDGRKCVYCGSKNDLAVDHILPLAHGGSDKASNLITSCKSCNSSKNGNRLLPIFESQILDMAKMANNRCGIDGNLVLSERLGFVQYVGGKMSEKTISDRRNVRVKMKSVSNFLSQEFVYAKVVKGKYETKLFCQRMYRRGAMYMNIPLAQKPSHRIIVMLHDNDEKDVTEIHRDELLRMLIPHIVAENDKRIIIKSK